VRQKAVNEGEVKKYEAISRMAAHISALMMMIFPMLKSLSVSDKYININQWKHILVLLVQS
jgi:hypothetical protein